LKVTPTGWNFLRNVPPQDGHSVSASSVMACTASKVWSHAVQT
jgi:hypothetical protein